MDGDNNSTNTNSTTSTTSTTDNKPQNTDVNKPQDNTAGDDKSKDTATFTQEDLNRVGKEQQLRGRKELMKKLGVKTDSDLDAMLIEIEEMRVNKEKGLTADQKAVGLQKQLDELSKTNADLQAKLDEMNNRNELLKLGVPMEQIDMYAFYSAKGVNETTDFITAAKDYIKKNPIQSKTPQINMNTGKPENTRTADEQLKKMRERLGIRTT